MAAVSKSRLPSYIDSRFTRRRFLKASAAVAGGAALVACSGASNNGLSTASSSREPGSVWFARNDWKIEDETKQAKRGGIYRGVMTADHAGHYDPMTIAPSQRPSADHIYEFLMARNLGPGIDPASAKANTPRPALAQSWDVVGDGVTITFKLRPGVRWHDVAPVSGREMDMEDWRTSMERFFTSSPERTALQDVFDKATYPDQRTMVWSMKFPFAPLVAQIWDERFAFLIMPKELNANPSLAESTTIGTGYKMLDKHQPAITIEYRKNPQYWGGDPFIERWHAPIIPEYSNRYSQFLTGAIQDFLPTARDVLDMTKDAPEAVIVGDPVPDRTITRIRFGRINHKTLPWKDQRVRIAIRNSIDFESIGEFLSNKAEFEANGIPIEIEPMTHLPHDPSYWLDPRKGELGGNLDKNYLYDAGRAKKLIEAAGYEPPIPVDYHALPEGAGIVPEEQRVVIDSLNQSGNFDVNQVLSLNTVEHRNCRSLGQCDGLVESGSNREADSVIWRDYHSEGNKRGEQAYPDPRIDAIAEAQRREMDPEKRIELLKDFQRIASELMPLVPFTDQFTTFRFRWPWLHNYVNGYHQIAGLPEGIPVLGGHLQWLDENMPDRGAS
jgi:peptide/nickel transport system substrate-binding protein